MKKYINLMCGAALLAALAAGCSGSFGFDGKDVPDSALGTGTGGGTGTEGDGSGGGSGNGGTGGGGSTVDVANPFKGTVWKSVNGNFTLTFAESTVSYSGMEYNYAPKRNDDGSYEATLTFKADAAVQSKEYGSLNLNSANAPFGRLVVGKTGSTCFLKDEGSDSGATDGFEITEDGRLVKYTGSRASVTVPGSVTYIGDGAFKDCAALESVRIPRTVESIGKDAFGGCAALRTVLYDGNETQWKNMLFYYDQQGNAVGDATGLRGRTVYSATTNNVSWAFNAAPSYWKDSDKKYNTVGMQIERYLGAEKTVKIPAGATSINAEALYNSGITSVTIPSTVTSIGEKAFSFSKLETITIHDGVTDIGQSAFYKCKSLASVTIPGSVTSISDSMFSGCTALTKVEISDGVTGLGKSAFSECTSLTSVTIPNSVTDIGNSAFSGCTGLTSVTIPGSVTSLGMYAFSGCTGLTSMTIPGSVSGGGRLAFSECTSLTNATIPGSITIGWICGEDNNLRYVEILDGETELRENICSGVKRLTNVTIPSSVTKIGHNAFNFCSDLTTVTYKGSLAQWCGIDWKSTTANPLINENAALYIEGEKVTNVEIPSSVTEIKDYVFCWYESLASVKIPDTVTSIGKYAFSGCGLTSVEIPGNVEVIQANAFYNCAALESVEISEGVTSIKSKAFSKCPALKTVKIPSTMGEIETEAFSECDSIETVYYNGTEQNWKDIQTKYITGVGYNYGLKDKTITGKNDAGEETSWTSTR